MTRDETSFLSILKVCPKKYIFLIFICCSSFYAYTQDSLFCLRLKLNDSIFLQLPILVDANHIIIPAYANIPHEVAPFHRQKDSMHFSVSIYENKFLLHTQSHSHYTGVWIKYAGKHKQYRLPCEIKKFHPQPVDTHLMKTFPSKWKVQLMSQNKKHQAVATFQYLPDSSLPHLSIGVATLYGDLGNINGYIQNDTLYAAVFNGAFATQMIAKIYYHLKCPLPFDSSSSQSSVCIDSLKGNVYYGNWAVEQILAIPDQKATLDDEIPLQDIFSPSLFIFIHQWKDINGKQIVIDHNKAIILQIMGSWCPNCVDETKLFTEWYPKISNNIQVIALAVERTHDSIRAIQILQQYQQKLNVPYPIVLLSDKGNKPPFSIFPELVKIPAFPTTIYFNKKHIPVVATIGFNGVSTSDLYLKTQTHIQQIIQKIIQ